MSSPSRALLLGLDFGSTTSHALLASARILRNCVTGRMELGETAALYRPDPVFTPFLDDRVDEPRLKAQLDRWLAESQVDPRAITSGGAIVTGLAAQAMNARVIADLVRARIGDAVVAVAEDPCLESWVAFMGSCGALSRAQPDLPFLNLDIGGGTTNFALGRDGEVTATGCWFVGARHLQVEPGTYTIRAISRYGAALLEHLGIRKKPGDALREEEVAAVVDCCAGLLESLVGGPPREPGAPRLLEQTPFAIPAGAPEPVITVSGGVGELVYRLARGGPPPATTAFGDLGIDLAERIVRSPLLSRNLKTHVPENLGRATVYGLALHNTEISGTTLFLPRPGMLPLRDLPILARFDGGAGPEEIGAAVAAAKRSGRGACLQITALAEDVESVRRIGGRLAEALRGFPAGLPLVLFVPRNVGKAVGSYATEWGRLAVDLVVIDELAARDARFASLGAPCEGVVPVSFYGMR